MTSDYKYPGLKCNRGISVVEALVASVLVVVASMVILPGLIQNAKTLRNITRGGDCQAYITKVFSRIERHREDASVQQPYLIPALPSTPSFVHTPGKPIFGIPDKLAQRFKNLGVDSLYKQNDSISMTKDGVTDTVEHNGVMLFTPLLANDEMGYLADLYNSPAPTKYQAGFVALPTELIPTSETALTQFEGDLHVELFDLDTGLPAATIPKFWPKPKNQFETIKIDHPNSDGAMVIAQFPQGPADKYSADLVISDRYGFLATVNGRMRNSDGDIVGECQATRAFSYGFDFHNVMDFTADFNLVTQASGGGSNLRDNTLSLSSKHYIASSIPDALKPIFTNVAIDPSIDGRERKECSQEGQKVPNFYLSLKVYNFDKESGLVPMCIDSSVQWLSSETAGGGWCASNYKTLDPSKSSRVLIDRSWKPLARGWVPCEELTFCNKAADKVEIVQAVDAKGKNYLEYRYHYTNIYADENEAAAGVAKNPLWGCELKYLVAGIDTAGNMIYPPSATQPTLADITSKRVVPSNIREVNPKIYFKPPPCETCECKRCKKSSGGFLGGFFKWFVFVILIVVTAGTAMAALPGWVTFISANLAGICLIGGLGCGGDGSSTPPPNISAEGKYRACQPMTDGCSCGFKCTKRRVPGPKWVDSLDSDLTEDDEKKLQAKLEEKACKPDEYRITSDGFTFTVKRAYKIPADVAGRKAPPNYDYDMEAKVMHFDEVVWQQFFPESGKFCFANFRCNNKNFEPVYEPYEDASGHTRMDLPNWGCFDVKVAHQINWPSSGPGVEATKPTIGPAVCLEPNINRLPFNESGEGLLGYNDLHYECGNDTGVESATPTHETLAVRRIVGRRVESCSTTKIDTPWGTKVGLTVPEPIMNSDSEGNTYFGCWKQCAPPLVMPQGPLTGEEQKYYEPYSALYYKLPFCTLNRDQFDN